MPIPDDQYTKITVRFPDFQSSKYPFNTDDLVNVQDVVTKYNSSTGIFLQTVNAR